MSDDRATTRSATPAGASVPHGTRREPPGPFVDACGLAELVRSGEASPLELVDAAIERIERVNPVINAVIHERFSAARVEAAGPLPDGPFRGVPILVKDLGAPSAGDPYHLGMGYLKRLGWRATHDSYLVQRLRRAGFVLLGRTNTPELGSTITTEPLAYGPTRNPWSLEHSTGGSSGGSAAAVAAGLVPVAHGNDGGGSIRIPASACGLVGLKPTRGRVSKGPDVGDSWAGATIDHGLTRTVRDTAALLDAIAGYHPGDPYVGAPPFAVPLCDAMREPARRCKVAVLDHAPMADAAMEVHPDCVAAVRSTARLLASLGHEVEEAFPAAIGDPKLRRDFTTVVAACTAADLAALETMTGVAVALDELEADNAAFATIGRRLSAVDYLDAVASIQSASRAIARFFADDGYDLLVTPVLAAPTPRLGYLSDPVHGGSRVLELLQFTAQFNLTGQPAISLPLGESHDGLPIGVQLVAAFADEALLVQVAAALEQASPWADRHPPVCA